MARIRTIKPGFFKSEDVSPLPLRARLTWVGLWTQCDDHGRTKDVAKLIKADVWPLDDVTLRDIEEDLAVLAAAKRIVRYEDDGKRYLAVINWHKHQSINRPSKAQHPAPPIATAPSNPDDPHHCKECAIAGTSRLAPAEQYASEPRETLTDTSVNGHGALTPGKEGNGEERRGRARAREAEPSPTPQTRPEPPLRCLKHLKNPTDDPCGGCKAARENHEKWEQERLAADAERRSAAAKGRAIARQAEIDACTMCDSTGYRAGRLCTHKVTTRRSA